MYSLSSSIGTSLGSSVLSVVDLVSFAFAFSNASFIHFLRRVKILWEGNKIKTCKFSTFPGYIKKNWEEAHRNTIYFTINLEEGMMVYFLLHA